MPIRIRRVLVVVLSTIGLGYLALCGAACGWQRAIVFPAPKQGRSPHAEMSVERVEGKALYLYRPATRPDAPVVVHFHGNGEQAADGEWLAQVLAEGGAGTALVEYPGYGLLAEQGSPSEEAIMAAAEAALGSLTTTHGVAKDRLVLSGQSLGSGVAVELARRGWGTRLLLFTPYTSLPDVGARALPFLPVRWLMFDRFDSASKAKDVALPVLIVHGTADEVIPQDLGRELSTRFPHAEFVSVPGGHHNDLWDRPEVLARATRFLLGPGE